MKKKGNRSRTFSHIRGELRRENDAVLDEEVAERALTVNGHALALNRLHEVRLSDALTLQCDSASVKVREVALKAE